MQETAKEGLARNLERSFYMKRTSRSDEQARSSFKFKGNRSGALSKVQALVGCFIVTALMLSQSETFASMACQAVFGASQTYSVRIKARYGLNDAQVGEMVEDVNRAAAFAEKHFRLPKEIALNLVDKNGFGDEPSYEQINGAIFAPYRFGLMRDGKFVAKSRRHAQSVFNHEFGHLIFHNNIGARREWVQRYSQSHDRATREGPYFRFIDQTYVEAYLQGYDELFADIFAVAISQNPRAMVSAEYFTIIDRPLHGFQASREAILRARDFLHKTDLETWNETEVHIRLAPTRSAFIDDPYVAHLLQTDPQHLARLALDAIHIELDRLFGDEVAVLSDTTVPELNRRMIKVMQEVLRADREKRGGWSA